MTVVHYLDAALSFIRDIAAVFLGAFLAFYLEEKRRAKEDEAEDYTKLLKLQTLLQIRLNHLYLIKRQFLPKLTEIRPFHAAPAFEELDLPDLMSGVLGNDQGLKTLHSLSVGEHAFWSLVSVLAERKRHIEEHAGRASDDPVDLLIQGHRLYGRLPFFKKEIEDLHQTALNSFEEGQAVLVTISKSLWPKQPSLKTVKEKVSNESR